MVTSTRMYQLREIGVIVILTPPWLSYLPPDLCAVAADNGESVMYDNELFVRKWLDKQGIKILRVVDCEHYLHTRKFLRLH